MSSAIQGILAGVVEARLPLPSGVPCFIKLFFR